MSHRNFESETDSESHDAGPTDGLDALARAVDQVADDLKNTETNAARTVPRPRAEPEARDRRGTHAALWAAALVAAVLSYPSYVGWTTLRGAGAAASATEARSGAPDLHWLSPPRDGARASAGSPTPLIVDGDRPLLLMVEIPVDRRTDFDQGLEYRIVAQDGRWILRGEIGADRYAQYMSDLEALPLHLHGHNMPPGTYRLSVSAASPTAAEVELTMRVERP